MTSFVLPNKRCIQLRYTLTAVVNRKSTSNSKQFVFNYYNLKTAGNVILPNAVNVKLINISENMHIAMSLLHLRCFEVY